MVDAVAAFLFAQPAHVGYVQYQQAVNPAHTISLNIFIISHKTLHYLFNLTVLVPNAEQLLEVIYNVL